MPCAVPRGQGHRPGEQAHALQGDNAGHVHGLRDRRGRAAGLASAWLVGQIYFWQFLRPEHRGSGVGLRHIGVQHVPQGRAMKERR